MYCSQCGKKIADTSKFCTGCGSPVVEEDEFEVSAQHKITYDAVEDIQHQLNMIDNREKTLRTKKANRSFLEIVKDELFEEEYEEKYNNEFKEKKQADKQKLILNFPLPNTSEDLLHFTKYIHSMITEIKKNNDPLIETWKEKLKQVYLFAKKEFSSSEEFVAIQNIYKLYKREDQRHTIGVLGFLMFDLMVLGVIVSLLNQIPWLFFVSVLTLLWSFWLMLYLFNLLDRMIASIKNHAIKKKGSLKLLRIIAWFLLMPALAALITSIVYFSGVIIALCAVIFTVDALFLLLSICYLYDL